MTCPHCLSSLVISNKEYEYYCIKCCRGKLREIEEDKPMTPAIKSNIMEGQLTETICTECGKLFRKLKKNARSLCPHCQNLKLCADYRERNRIGHIGG
jgi:predicted RNA-binding Zn-ribbon protein involved in translation (DUF1610 family)